MVPKKSRNRKSISVSGSVTGKRNASVDLSPDNALKRVRALASETVALARRRLPTLEGSPFAISFFLFVNSTQNLVYSMSPR